MICLVENVLSKGKKNRIRGYDTMNIKENRLEAWIENELDRIGSDIEEE